MASQLSLQGLNFSSSLLSGSKPQSTETYPVAEISYNNVIALPKDKEIRLSSGKIIKIKPKKETYSALIGGSTYDLSINSKPQHLGLIDIDKLYSKLQVEKRVSEQQPDSYKPLENKFKRNSFKLWVEKYRPSSFLDLIGNERTNRLILQWLNQWNPMVFNKDGPNINQQHPQYEQQQNNKPIDPFQRPDRKILLIHGPPGIGKTSIAHVIAKQLKYEIHEINASDERAGSAVKDKIKNSMKNVNFIKN